MKIVILSNEPNGYSTERIRQAAIKRLHTVKIIHPYDCDLVISDSKNGHDKIWADGENLSKKEVDAVITRSGAGTNYGLAVIEQLNGNMGIACTNNSDSIRIASNKFLAHQKLSQAKIRTVRTIFSKRPDSIKKTIENLGGLPAVGKILSGSQGQGVFLMESKMAANTTLQSFHSLNVDLILQSYLSDTRDIRAFVVDGEVKASMERLKLKDDFRKNASLGSEVKAIELTEDETQQAIEAAAACGLGVAGIDLLRDEKQQKSYVLEVNSAPSLKKISTVSKVDLADEIVKYAEKLAGDPEYQPKMISFHAKTTQPTGLASWFNPNHNHNKMLAQMKHRDK